MVEEHIRIQAMLFHKSTLIDTVNSRQTACNCIAKILVISFSKTLQHAIGRNSKIVLRSSHLGIKTNTVALTYLRSFPFSKNFCTAATRDPFTAFHATLKNPIQKSSSPGDFLLAIGHSAHFTSCHVTCASNLLWSVACTIGPLAKTSASSGNQRSIKTHNVLEQGLRVCNLSSIVIR